MTKVVNVVGARPQFIKAGPVSKALSAAGIEEVLVHTGQHYDQIMSQRIFEDVGLREPDVNLGVGSASHAVQTARILEGVERLLEVHKPSVVVTYGDTNSTLAAALAASKLGLLTAHVEAGLRSFNRSMPEEINRVATDHLSDLLFAPTRRAVENLSREGLSARTELTGDVMVDALEAIDLTAVALPEWAVGDFYVATIHRASNTDDGHRLAAILRALATLDRPTHLLAHPRLQARLDEHSLSSVDSVTVRPPIAYRQMLATLNASSGIFTDSGGLQKEAFILGVRCVTLRRETEWPETLVGGWNILSDIDVSLTGLMDRPLSAPMKQPFGDGTAAERLVRHLVEQS